MKYYRIPAPALDISDTIGTTEKLFSLPVPHGVRNEVTLNIRVINPLISPAVYLRCPDDNAMPPAFDAAPLGLGLGLANTSTMQQVRVITDLEGRIAVTARTDDTTFMASLLGWKEVQASIDLAWTSRVVADGGRIDAVANLGAGVLLCAARGPQRGKIYRSTDYGSTWTQVARVSTAWGVTGLAAGLNGEAFAITEDARLWKSADAGLTWADMGQVSSNPWGPGVALSYSVTVLPTGTVLVLDSDPSGGHVFRSTDGGTTFQSIVASTSGLYRLMQVGDGVLANGWGGKIHKSTDDGQTWTAGVQLSLGPLYAIEYLGDGIVLSGSGSGKVWRSLDNGDTWECLAKLDGEADDFASLGGGKVIYSTYTGRQNVYFSDEYGRAFRPIGKVPSGISGDWLDHAITVETPAGVIAVGGTAYGAIVTCAVK